MTAEQLRKSKRFYRCKTKDAALYKKLQEILARFVSLDRLKEVAHGMDTNVNESINNTISYFAPKNRVYCSSRSLQNRVAMSIGIISLGFDVYFRRLFKALGVQIHPAVIAFLQSKEKHRQKQLLKRKLTATKRERKAAKFAKLEEEEAKALRARAKRDGTYKTGGNLEEGGFYGDRKQKAKSSSNAVCPHCGVKGHKTTRSKKCLANPQHKDYNPNLVPDSLASNALPQAMTVEEQEAIATQDDVDQMDQLPFVDNLPDIEYENDEFHDCGTWSDDDNRKLLERGIL